MMLNNSKTSNVTVSFSRSSYIPKNEERCFRIGYLFLRRFKQRLAVRETAQFAGGSQDSGKNLIRKNCTEIISVNP